jgi:DNA-binding protein HU-beta
MAKSATAAKSFTKAELVEMLAEKLETPKSNAAKIFDGMFDLIKHSLAKKKTVTIPQFGTFNVQGLKKRKGRNPQTGEEIMIPASKTVRFKPSVTLKKEFNK